MNPQNRTDFYGSFTNGKKAQVAKTRLINSPIILIHSTKRNAVRDNRFHWPVWIIKELFKRTETKTLWSDTGLA